MTNTSGLDNLARLLSPKELELLGTAFRAGQPTAMAVAVVRQDKNIETRTIIDQILLSIDKKVIGDVLGAMATAAEMATSEIEVVWSGPIPNDAMGRTTWGVLSEVVQSAREFIYAATYSAAHNAPAIVALRGAIDRGIEVTCMLDIHNRPEATEIMKTELRGARFLGIASGAGRFEPMMHAKFIVVDGHSTFLTSANFSNIAVDKSLEVGLLVQNSFVAHQFKRRIDDLLTDGLLFRVI